MTFNGIIVAIVSVFVLMVVREQRRVRRGTPRNRVRTKRDKWLRAQSWLGFTVALLTTLIGMPFLILLALLGGFSSGESKGQSEAILGAIVGVALVGWVIHNIAESKLRAGED